MASDDVVALWGLGPKRRDEIDPEDKTYSFFLTKPLDIMGKFKPSRAMRDIMLNCSDNPLAHNPKREMTGAEQTAFKAINSQAHAGSKRCKGAKSTAFDDEFDDNTVRIPGCAGQDGVRCWGCGEASAMYMGYRMVSGKGVRADVYTCIIPAIAQSAHPCAECPLCDMDDTVSQNIRHMRTCKERPADFQGPAPTLKLGAP